MRRPLRLRRRRWIVAALVIVVVCAALCATALLAWPRVDLDPADVALAHIALPHFAGRVTAAMVSLPTGEPVPVQLRNGDLWPQGKLAAGEPLTVRLTVRRPSWAGWLVGHTQRRSFALVTPSAHLLGRWLQVPVGSPVTVAFDAPVEMISRPDRPRGRCPARGRSCRWAWSPAARAAPGRSRSPPLLGLGSVCRRRSR